MKYLIISAIFFTIFVETLGAEDGPAIKDDTDKINYSLGYQIGGDFKRQHVEIRPELVVKGIEDALSDAAPMMTSEEMNKTLVDLKRKIVADQQAAQMREAEENLVRGKAFLEANKSKEGVQSLPSGLQYKVINKGSGISPSATATVTVHYRGTLIDGTEFDSSYRRGQPASFQANQVIEGWREALQLMKVGSKWQLFIPPELAYGAREMGSVIKPNSTLIFEVELLSIGNNSGEEKTK